MPAPSPPMYAHFTSSHARRGAFATRHLWVTPHSDDEKWPAGEYPLQREDDERARGLVHWTNQVGLTAASPKWGKCSNKCSLQLPLPGTLGLAGNPLLDVTGCHNQHCSPAAQRGGPSC